MSETSEQKIRSAIDSMPYPAMEFRGEADEVVGYLPAEPGWRVFWVEAVCDCDLRPENTKGVDDMGLEGRLRLVESRRRSDPTEEERKVIEVNLGWEHITGWEVFDNMGLRCTSPLTAKRDWRRWAPQSVFELHMEEPSEGLAELAEGTDCTVAQYVIVDPRLEESDVEVLVMDKTRQTQRHAFSGHLRRLAWELKRDLKAAETA